MDILNRMENYGPDNYYDSKFMDVLEKNIPYLNTQIEKTVDVEEYIAEKYQGDYFGLLTYYRIPKQYRWITMRVNGLLSPTDSDINTKVINIPNFDKVAVILSIHKSQNKLRN